MIIRRTKIGMLVSLAFYVAATTTTLAVTIAPANAQSVTSPNCTTNGTEIGNDAYALTCGSTATNTGNGGAIAGGQGASASSNSVVIGNGSSDNLNNGNSIYGSANQSFDATNTIVGGNNTIGAAATNGSGANVENVLLGYSNSLTGTVNNYVGTLGQIKGSDNNGMGFGVLVNGSFNNFLGNGVRITTGGAVALGSGTTVAGANGVAVGFSASTPDANSVALGANSITDGRTYEVSIANATGINGSPFTRVLTGLAPGVNGNDAVNMNQFNGLNTTVTQIGAAQINMGIALTGVANSFGGGAAYDTATGLWTSPTYNVGGNTYHDVGSALTNLDGRLTTAENNITNLQSGSGGSTTNAVTYDSASKTDVTLAGTNGTAIHNVAAGSNPLDAVNYSQLSNVQNQVNVNTQGIYNLGIASAGMANAFGGGANFNGTTFTGPTYSLASGTYTNVGSALNGLQGQITGLQNQVNNLPTGGGTTGPSTDNNAVHYANGTGSGDININGGGQIHNVNSGTANTDAANVGQMNQAISTSASNTLSQANTYTDNKFNQVQKAQKVQAIDYDKTTPTDLVVNDGARISNLSDGIANSDAATVGQVNNAIAPIQNQVNNQQNQISDLYNKYGDLKNRINAVGASAMAASSLVPMPGSSVGEVQVGAAIGTYGGESAIAVGGFYNAGNAMYNLKVTAGTHGGVGAGIGATFRLNNLF